MVLRARGGRDAGRSGGLRLRRPVRSSESPPKPPRGPRRRSTVIRLARGLNSRKVPQNHLKKHKKDVGKPARFVIRKSPRLQNPADSRRGVLRRSTRPTKPIRTSAARSVLKNVDSMKKKRRSISTNKEEAYSRARRRTAAPPQAELSDSDSDGCFFRLADADDITTAEDDSSCSAERNLEAKPSRASSLYQRASREFLKGSFRTNTSETNRIRRGASRATEVAWSNPLDEDDSEDGGQNIVKFSERDVFGTHISTSLADIDPVAIDRSVGFDSIGGLSGHIAALKEMVIFPLLYPEVFDNFKIQPPRGCLFYGPPGTGKTLVARALANECGNRKVSFFMRKGADCLSKWVGESERQLRLLFEQAYHMRPSIIFLDEIDGLAPVRSSRQDHIHSSIVSTLLALMDGLDARGEVVVIGATNRLDAIDPALRRPGRFDREFLFGLPDRESRKEILKIHTAQWKPRPSEDFLDELADRCVGYCGADIRAVCTEATLCALRRRYPQIYTTSQKLLLDVSSIAVNSFDFEMAMKKMSPASRRLGASPAKPLSAVVQPLLGPALRDILEALQRLFPHAEQGMRRKREPNLTSGVLDDGLMCGGEPVSSSCTSFKATSLPHSARSAVKQPMSHRPRLLLAGRPAAAQTSHLAPAVLHALERFAVHSLDSAALFGASSSTPEEVCAQVFSEARRTSPSIIYIPHIQQWWETAGPPLRVSFSSLLCSIPSFSPILLLATCSAPYGELDPEIQSLFRMEYGEVYTIGVPTRQERTDFFQDLILHQAAEAPPSNKQTRTETVEILPLAPTPLARQPSEPVAYEEHVLRELRLFLRNVTERLILDRRFKAFSKAADTEEVPAHLKTAKRPMDLQRLLANIDEYKYITVGEYMSDAELIWQDALKWRPDSGAVDHHIRHCALALKDMVHAIVRDELDEDFERECEKIREARVRRASSWRSKVDYESDGSGFPRNTPSPPSRKKKRYRRPRKSKWSTGVIKKVKKKKLPLAPCSSSSSSSSISESSQDEAPTSSAAPSSSSDPSESSDGEPSRLTNTVNRCRRSGNTARRVQNGFQANGHRRPSERLLRSRTSRTPLTRRMLVNGLCWDQKGQFVKTCGTGLNQSYTANADANVNAAAAAATAAKQPFYALRERGTRKSRRSEGLKDRRPAQGLPRLLLDRRTLRDLLGRAVDQTEGAEVEPLEKLYALLAQCIYRHRDSYDKTQLLQEMKKEIDSFS